MRAYFDLTAPLFLVQEPTFHGYPVEVSKKTIQQVVAINQLVRDINDIADAGGAPEDHAQQLADLLTDRLEGVLTNDKAKATTSGAGRSNASASKSTKGN